MTTLLASTATAGAAAIYHSYLYNQEKTIENYEQQLNAVSYAVGKELDYEPLKGFNDTTANAYYDYIIKKFDASSYILFKENEVVCNMTPFLFTELSDERWEMLVRGSVIQKSGNRYILLAGRDVPVMDVQSYKLVLVRDISSLYEDIRRQALFYLVVYLGVALFAVLVVSAMTRKALAPLRELQQAAQAAARRFDP